MEKVADGKPSFWYYVVEIADTQFSSLFIENRLLLEVMYVGILWALKMEKKLYWS